MLYKDNKPRFVQWLGGEAKTSIKIMLLFPEDYDECLVEHN